MPPMTVSEMEQKIQTYEAALPKLQTEIDSLKKYVADAEAKKKAEGEAEGEGKKKMGEAKYKSDAEAKRAEAKKHLKAASESDDEKEKNDHLEKASSLLAEAEGMKHKAEAEGKKKAEGEADDEEKEDMKAEIMELRKIATKPKLQILTAAYKDKVPEATLKTYTANWKQMSIKELDAEIERVAPFIANTFEESQIPIDQMGSTLPVAFEAEFAKDEFTANLEKMPLSELFGGSD